VIPAFGKTLGADRTFKIAELCQKCVTRISHKFEMQRGGGAEGKEQGTLNSPLLPCSPAQGFDRCGEKSGVSVIVATKAIYLSC